MKILVIGAGSIGTRHIRNLLALGYKNLIVSDTDEGKLKAVSALGNFNLYKNARTALRKEKPQAVFVCVPAHLHVPLAHAALAAGAHVFIEKPLSVNLFGVNALIKKAKMSGRTVMVACNFLFYEGFQKLKKALSGGIYGEAMLCRVAQGFYIPMYRKNYKKNYISKKREGGGVILDHALHPVYYLNALLGDIRKKIVLSSCEHPLGLASEEAAMLMLEHENGVISSISSDYISKKITHRVEVVTDKGTLTLDIGQDSVVFEDGKAKKELYRGNKDMNKMYVEELKHFFRYIKQKRKPLQDLTDAKKILKTIIYESNF